jgi:hypothetical protein
MGCNPVTYSGFNEKTAKNILVDSASFFKNFKIGTDTYASAKAAGKLLGATQGGGSFSAVPTMRTIQADGVKGRAKGLEVIDSWEVMMSMNLLELNKENIAAALITGRVTIQDFYEKVEAGNYLCDIDYIDNITMIGRISGTKKPIIIQIFNVTNTNGLNINATDNAEGIATLEFKGSYTTTTLDTPPFVIYYPKAEGTISGLVVDDTTPTPIVQSGATVTITIDAETIETTTDTAGEFLLENIPYGTGYTVTATKGTATGTKTSLTVVGGQDTDAGTIEIVSP